MGFRSRRRPPFDAGAFDSIVAGVKAIYREKVRPLEEAFLVQDFHYPLLTDDDFDAKPMVLLVGSYSTGKTSFIRYLLEQDFPGMHIGPEPTTDGFQAIFYGPEVRSLPGHALVSSATTPFRGLAQVTRPVFYPSTEGVKTLGAWLSDARRVPHTCSLATASCRGSPVAKCLQASLSAAR